METSSKSPDLMSMEEWPSLPRGSHRGSRLGWPSVDWAPGPSAVTHSSHHRLSPGHTCPSLFSCFDLVPGFPAGDVAEWVAASPGALAGPGTSGQIRAATRLCSLCQTGNPRWSSHPTGGHTSARASGVGGSPRRARGVWRSPTGRRVARCFS